MWLRLNVSLFFGLVWVFPATANECAEALVKTGLAYIAYPVPLEQFNDVFKDKKNLTFPKRHPGHEAAYGSLVTTGRMGHKIPELFTLRVSAPSQSPEMAGVRVTGRPIHEALTSNVLVLLDPRILAHARHDLGRAPQLLSLIRELTAEQAEFDYRDRQRVWISDPIQSLDVIGFIVAPANTARFLDEVDPSLYEATLALTHSTPVFPRVPLARAYHRASLPKTEVSDANLAALADAAERELVALLEKKGLKEELLSGAFAALLGPDSASQAPQLAGGIQRFAHRTPRHWGWELVEYYGRIPNTYLVSDGARQAGLERLLAWIRSR